MRLRATSRSPRDPGPAIFGLVTWLLAEYRLSPSHKIRLGTNCETSSVPTGKLTVTRRTWRRSTVTATVTT